LQTQLRSFILCRDLSHTVFEKATAVWKLAGDGVASKRSITHAILGLFQETYKPAFHIYRAILESFFYAYSAIVDSFVIASFFLEKHYIPHSAVGYYR